MSADNWAVCPRCKKKASAKLDAELAKLESEYGEIPAKQYRERAEKLDTRARQLAGGLDCTFREDYEIRMDEDGCFSVGYFGSCGTCGLKFQFNHEEKLSDIA